MIKKLITIFLTITVIFSSLTVIIYADEDEWEEIEIPESRVLSPEEQAEIDELISPYLHDFGDESINTYWSIFLNELGYMYFHQDEEVEDGHHNYESLFHCPDNFISMYLSKFEDYTNQSSDVYSEMDSFEQELWRPFYLHVMMFIIETKYQSNFSSWERFKMSAIYSEQNYLGGTFPDGRINGVGSGSLLLGQSYRAIMQWLYYNYVNTGEWLNLVTGKTHLEEMGLVSPNEEGEIVGSDALPNETTLSEDEEILMSVLSVVEESRNQENDEGRGGSDDGDGKKGIWKNVGENLKENKVTFIILAILIVGFLGVVFVRKSKNVDKK